MSAGMFAYYRQFQGLLATCTASATPGSTDSLISAVCYDSAGCCDDDGAATAPMKDVAVSYQTCIMSAASPEDKLACTDMPVSG